MKDLFLQCMCVRMCFSCSGMSICAHVDVEEPSYVTCTDTGEYQMPSLEDREERRFLTMEEG